MLRSTIVIFAVLFAAGSIEAAAEDCRPRRQAEVRVEFLRALPLVNLTVNGTAATFLLDTGAERTIMSATAAKRLGVAVHYEYPRSMRSLDGTLASGDASLHRLGLGDRATLSDFRVLVGSVSLPGPDGRLLDGLLGADFFASFEVDLDLPHNRMILYERQHCALAAPPWSQSYSTIPANRSLHDHLFFPVVLDGRRFAAFLDSGAEVSALDLEAAIAVGVTDAELNRDPVANLRGAGSELVRSRAHRFAHLEVGAEKLHDRVITVTNLRLQDADLVLGIDFLQFRRVWLSYGSHQIFLARPI